MNPIRITQILAVAGVLAAVADLNIGGVLVANRAAASTWEQFTFTSL